MTHIINTRIDGLAIRNYYITSGIIKKWNENLLLQSISVRWSALHILPKLRFKYLSKTDYGEKANCFHNCFLKMNILFSIIEMFGIEFPKWLFAWLRFRITEMWLHKAYSNKAMSVAKHLCLWTSNKGHYLTDKHMYFLIYNLVNWVS